MLRFLLAIFMITGFSVGAGFLALTAAVGLSGIWGGLISLILVWLLGIASGLLYIEAFLAVPQANHLVSLCRHLTGRFNTLFTGYIYVFFNYTILIIGYIFLYNLFHMNFEEYTDQHRLLVHLWLILLSAFFGLLIYLGHKVTLLAVALVFLLFLSAFSFGAYTINLLVPPKIGLKPHLLFILFAIGTIFNFSFYQSVLPTVVQFLKRDRKQLIRAVWIGYSLAMFILLVWLWMTLRPDIYPNFLAAFEAKSAYTKGFFFLIQTPLLKYTFRFLVTSSAIVSILCSAISLMDFFEDTGFRFFKNQMVSKILYLALIFLPSWGLSLILHKHFMIFSTLFTSFIEVLLANVFPLQWVWNIRYRLALPVKPVLFGGKKMIVVMIFVTAILFLVVGTVPIHLIDL